jgi:hypothetical protein
MMTRVGVLVIAWCLGLALYAYPSMAQEGGDAQQIQLLEVPGPVHLRFPEEGGIHAKDTDMPVTWLGWVVTGEERESASLPFPERPEVKAFYNIVDHHNAYQLGLRADGVVVWRPMPKETPDGR